VSAPNFFAQFALPKDEQNFDMELGAAHLSVANDTPSNRADLTGSNLNTLKDNLARGKSAPWNLLMHHKPMWNAGQHVDDATTIRAAWGSAIDDAKVDLVLNGHDHDYQRTKKLRAGVPTVDGTTIVVVGSAGAPLYDVTAQSWTEKVEKTNSFAILRIRRTMLQLDAFHLDGSALDSFILTK
jgi:3',5'-cyclic AMP phosphodiesterase CpdA